MEKKDFLFHKTVFSLIIIIIIMIFIGVWFYLLQEKKMNQAVENQLLTISRFKSAEIAEWRKNRITEALSIIESDFFIEPAISIIVNNQAGKAREKMLTRFKSLMNKFGYAQIILTKPNGMVSLRTSPETVPIPLDMVQTLEASIAGRKPFLTDLHFSNRDNKIHFDIILPLIAPEINQGRPFGSLMLRIDADKSLYKILEGWPVPSRTAEVLLVRREGNDVLFLNELRHQKDSALKLRIPLSRTEIPAVRAVLGKKDVSRGMDYRGVQVIAVTQPVPDSPWFIVAKVDTEEAFAGWRFQSRLILLLLLGSVLAVTAVGWILWQRNRIAYIQETAEAKARFKTLFDFMNEGVCVYELVFNAAGKPINYRILDVNPAFTTLTGISGQSSIGKLATEVYRTPEAPYLEAYSDAALNGKASGFETYFAPLNRHLRISVFQPAPGQFATILMDISQEKEAETKIAEEKELLSVTLRSIGDGVITTDIAGRIVLMNPVAEELTGWKLNEARGQLLLKVFNIVNEFTRKPCINPVERVLQEGIVVELSNNTMLISRNGKEYIIADSGAPIRNAGGNVIGVVLVFHDITEKQRMMENIQRSQKLESVGMLAGGIAHDFNNLLSGIFGYVEIARKGLDTDDIVRASNALSKALAVFDRARSLTHQLLTFAKGGAPVRRVQLIEPLLRHSSQFALSGSNVSATFELDPDLWPCDVDESQIEQVIDNLLINAKQAMPDGGHVLIRAANIHRKKSEDPLLPEGGDFVKITFADTGTGIPKENIIRIFDPFFTTKAYGQGLGLATVHSIILKHGGNIVVESTPGTGTCFTFYLPASRGPAVRFAEARESLFPRRGKGRILVMDDEELLLEIAADKLSDLGYEAAVCKSGEEAIALFTEAIRNNRPFAAVIMDLTIPGGMGGREAIMEIRKLDKIVPVIATSGYADNPVMSSPENFGFSGSLRKPYREAELADLLDKLI